MEKAKAAIKDFTHRSGNHSTDVTEHYNPAVTNENVTPTRHENTQTVVDREVHQDHHHTTVQPVKDRQVLPEQHTHNQAPTEHKEYKHGDDHALKERLRTEAAQFKDTSVTSPTKVTSSTAPTVGGEHVHHHVHETIQPVVQRETIQPSVVHTTVPVHEVHKNESKHHAATALPAVSMDEFKKTGGALSGRTERHDEFEGEPRGQSVAGHGARSDVPSTTGTHGTHSGTHGTHSGTTGTHGTSGVLGSGHSGVRDSNTLSSDRNMTSSNAGPHGTVGNKLDPRVDSDRDGSSGLGRDGAYGSTTSPSSTRDTTGTGNDRYTSGTGSDRYGSGTSGIGSATTTGSGTGTDGYHGKSHADATSHQTKPSLMDRLNPMKDTDGDGKKGMMD